MSNVMQFVGRTPNGDTDEVLTGCFDKAFWTNDPAINAVNRASFGEILRKRKYSEDAVECWLHTFDESLHRFRTLRNCLGTKDDFAAVGDVVVYSNLDEGWGNYPTFMYLIYHKFEDCLEPALGFKINGYVFDCVASKETLAEQRLANHGNPFLYIDHETNPDWLFSEASTTLLLNQINTLALLTQSGWGLPKPKTANETNTAFFEVTYPAKNSGFISGGLAVINSFSASFYKSQVKVSLIPKEAAVERFVLAEDRLLRMYLPWEQVWHLDN